MVQEPSLSYYLLIARGRIVWFLPFPMWNANSLIQDLILIAESASYNTVTITPCAHEVEK